MKGKVRQQINHRLPGPIGPELPKAQGGWREGLYFISSRLTSFGRQQKSGECEGHFWM